MQAPGPAGDGRTHVGTLLVSNSLFSEVNCWFCTCNCRMVAINLRGSREHASRCRSSPVLPPSMLSPQPQGQSKGSGVLRPHSSCASEGERESKTVGSPPFPLLARHYVECAECKPQPDPSPPPPFTPQPPNRTGSGSCALPCWLLSARVCRTRDARHSLACAASPARVPIQGQPSLRSGQKHSKAPTIFSANRSGCGEQLSIGAWHSGHPKWGDVAMCHLKHSAHDVCPQFVRIGISSMRLQMGQNSAGSG